jgi:hypothetical protein
MLGCGLYYQGPFFLLLQKQCNLFVLLPVTFLLKYASPSFLGYIKMLFQLQKLLLIEISRWVSKHFGVCSCGLFEGSD